MQGVKGTTSLVTRTCLHCGREFLASYTKQKFCSHQCYADSLRGILKNYSSKVERHCEICNKVFYTKPYYIRKGQARFCSIRCHCDYLITQASVSKVCEVCGKEFIIKRHQSARRFCSLVCMGMAKRGKTLSPHTSEWKQKRSDALKGTLPPYLKEYYLEHGKYPSGVDHHLFGKVITGDIRKKWSEIKKRDWQDPEYVAKMMAARAVKPTRPEKRLKEICGKHFPDFEYNGDFSLEIMLGGQIPDFVNTNGKKEIIEVFGDYYHSPEVLGDRWQGSELGKIMAYNSLGWRCLVVWEHELKDKAKVIAKIKAFVGGKK